MNGYCKLLTLAVVALAMTATPGWAGSIEGKVTCGAICGNLLIYVEGVPGEWSGEGEVAILDQVKKTYVPHVQAILQGTAMRLKNSDPELHNVHAYQGKKTVFNVAMVPGLSFDMKRFKEPGTFVVLCDIHTEMSAYIVVRIRQLGDPRPPPGDLQRREVRPRGERRGRAPGRCR